MKRFMLIFVVCLMMTLCVCMEASAEIMFSEEAKAVFLADKALEEKYGITVVMVKRDDEYLPVSKDTTFEKGDTLSLFGPFSNIKTLFRNDENNENSEEKPAKSG